MIEWNRLTQAFEE